MAVDAGRRPHVVGEGSGAELGDPFAELEELRFPAWALSLYLPAPSDLVYASHHHQKLFDQLDREHLLGPVDDLAVEVMHRERARVHAHLAGLATPQGHALALFAYEPYGLLRSWCLVDDEPPLLSLGTSLHLEPIRRQLKLHPPALVVAADKKEARIFRVLLGEVEELASLAGEDVKRHHQGGWSSLNLQRHEDEAARHNLGAVARWLGGADLTFYGQVRLAAPPEARAELERLLPARVQARLGATLSLPMYLSSGEMARLLREESAAAPPA